MVALIARRSKYDFWIPDKILTLETKIQIKKYFSEIENFDRKIFPNFFSDQKKSYPKIEKIFFSKNRFSRFLDPKKNDPKKIPNIFFDQNFRSRKNIFLI